MWFPRSERNLQTSSLLGIRPLHWLASTLTASKKEKNDDWHWKKNQFTEARIQGGVYSNRRGAFFKYSLRCREGRLHPLLRSDTERGIHSRTLPEGLLTISYVRSAISTGGQLRRSQRLCSGRQVDEDTESIQHFSCTLQTQDDQVFLVPHVIDEYHKTAAHNV